MKYTIEQVHQHFKQFVLEQKPQQVNIKLAQYIISKNPKTIFEFGCNTGRVLTLIEINSDIKCTGMDLSSNAIVRGRELHPDIKFICGKEKQLRNIKSQSFDLVFTSACLVHNPPDVIKDIVKELKRITKKHLVACEMAAKFHKPYYFDHDYKKLGYKFVYEDSKGTEGQGDESAYGLHKVWIYSKKSLFNILA